MTRTPRMLGLIQAVGLVLYVGLFAVVVEQARNWIKVHAIAPHPILAIILFLLAFVISALISGSLILAYPAYLFLESQRLRALKIVGWSVAWLVVLFCGLALIGLGIVISRAL